VNKHLVFTAMAALLLAGNVPARAHATMSTEAQAASTQQQPSSDKASQPKQTPEQIAALKAEREKALKMNAIITQASADMQAKNWAQAVVGFKQLIEMDPNQYDFYASLGAAQLNLGQYEDALRTLDKGIELAQKPAGPRQDPAKAKAALSQMLTNEGNCYLKLGKSDAAIARFEKAAALAPNPGMAYFNLCATQYNMGKMDAAVAACEKSIAADPTRADAYFIRGSALYGNGSLDKQNKFIVPPGTVEALNKYLELAPNGGHAADVKAMLEALGEPVKTSYGEKKKEK
jgi:tetratricopeptide (TPR) repeat protein